MTLQKRTARIARSGSAPLLHFSPELPRKRERLRTVTAYRNSEVRHNFPSSPLRGDVIDELMAKVDRVLGPPQPATIEATSTPPLKFDAAFIDRRMAEHRDWQERTLLGLTGDVIREVACALDYVQKVRAGRGPQKIARLR